MAVGNAAAAAAAQPGALDLLDQRGASAAVAAVGRAAGALRAPRGARSRLMRARAGIPASSRGSAGVACGTAIGAASIVAAGAFIVRSA